MRDSRAGLSENHWINVSLYLRALTRFLNGDVGIPSNHIPPLPVRRWKISINRLFSLTCRQPFLSQWRGFVPPSKRGNEPATNHTHTQTYLAHEGKFSYLSSACYGRLNFFWPHRDFPLAYGSSRETQSN